MKPLVHDIIVSVCDLGTFIGKVCVATILVVFILQAMGVIA